MALTVKTFINNPVSSNCHIIYDDSEKHGIVVDPGSEDSSEILSFVRNNALVVDYVILTSIIHGQQTNSLLLYFVLRIVLTL